MTEHVNPVRRKRHLPFVIAYLFAGLLTSGRCEAQDGTLAEPFPAPAPNAALHYQRALLHLAKLDDDQAQLFWATTTSSQSEGNSVRFSVVGDGQFHDYELDMSRLPQWRGLITSLRFDPSARSGATFAVDSIRF